MLTWTLWRAVRNPPSTHPIFLHIFNGKYIQFHRFGYIAWLILAPLLLCGLSFYLHPSLNFTFVAAIMQFYFLYVGIHSLTWAMNVSSTIVKEQEANTHDLLGVTPVGSVGAYWAIFTGCIYRKGEFLNFNNNGTTWIIRVLFAISIIFVPVSNAGGRVVDLDSLVVLVYLAALVAAFYIDHIQSVLLGSLVGMLIPTTTHNPVESRLFVLGSFLAIQGISYFLVWLTLSLLSALYDAIPQQSIIVAMSLPILRVIIFYAIREGFVRLLWERLGRQLNASDLELTLLTAPSAE